MGSCDPGHSSLGSPPLSTGCFTQGYTPAAVSAPASRGGCLCDTPQGPELRTLCSASAGRLPVRCLDPVSSAGIALGAREAADGAGGEQGVGDPRMYSPLPSKFCSLYGSLPPLMCLSGSGGGCGLKSEVAVKWLGCFSTSPRSCIPAALASASWPFSAPFFSPACKKSGLCLSTPSAILGPSTNPFYGEEMRNGYRQNPCLRWARGTSPAHWFSPLWSCDPRGDPSPGEAREHGTGVLQRCFPSVVSARGCSGAGNGCFL